MKSRIAIFSGWRSPKGYGAQIFKNSRPVQRDSGLEGYGAQIFQNSRPVQRDSGLEGYGRRGYYVPIERAYGPVRKKGGRRPVVKSGYRVKRMKDTPAMKKQQNRMKKAARVCSRKSSKRGAKKGTYKRCMRVQLRKGKR